MKYLIWIFSLTSSLFTASAYSCDALIELDKTHGINRPMTERDFFFSIYDKLSEKEFELILESRSENSLCVGIEMWPGIRSNPAREPLGLPFSSEEVYIEQNGERYPIKHRLSIDCKVENFKDTSSCHINIPPGAVMRSAIPYELFESGFSPDDPKTLVYFPSAPGVQPVYCDLQKNFTDDQWQQLKEEFEYQFDPDHPDYGW